MHHAKMIQKLYICLMAIVLLMVTATVLSILQVTHPISGGDIQTDVQVNVPTPTPAAGVAGHNIERTQISPTPTIFPANDQADASKMLSTATSIPSSSISKNTPTPTSSPVVTPTHITAKPIACALGSTPLPQSQLFCNAIR